MARYLNGATIMTTPTPRSLAVAREAGFDGIEARAERLLDGSEELRATASAVRPGEVWSLNGLRVSLEADGSLDRELLETDLDARLDVCRAIGAESLDAFPVERLAMVHINDAPQKPPPEIEDADRLMPGLGVIRLPWLIAALQARGFAGPWSLETFNPGYWTEDPALVARRG